MPTRPIDDAVTPAMFHILAALADRDLHGYAIMREIDERTGGSGEVGPGTLYRTLKQLLERGLVEECGPSVNKKRTYRITDSGRRTASGEARRLAGLVKWASDVRLIEGTS